jgi:hypothetical protein
MIREPKYLTQRTQRKSGRKSERDGRFTAETQRTQRKPEERSFAPLRMTIPVAF